jgi:hypothetical protein
LPLGSEEHEPVVACDEDLTAGEGAARERRADDVADRIGRDELGSGVDQVSRMMDAPTVLGRDGDEHMRVVEDG